MSRPGGYDVPPFSGSDFNQHMEKCPPNTTPCAICGRPVRSPWPHNAVVVEGGAAWGTDESPIDAGYMGYWPVGSDCHRRHVVQGRCRLTIPSKSIKVQGKMSKSKSRGPDSISLTEAVERTGVPAPTLRQWLARGAIPGGVKSGGVWLVPVNMLEKIRNRDLVFERKTRAHRHSPRPYAARPGFVPAIAQQRRAEAEQGEATGE